MAKKRTAPAIQTPNEFRSLAQEWLTKPHSDRGVAIIGGTLVEQFLGRYLESRMQDLKLNKGATVFGELFGPGRPLDTFSAKIKLSFALGFVGTKVFNELDTIREIRNRFAHDIFSRSEKLRPLSFESADVGSLCAKLVFPSYPYAPIIEFPDGSTFDPTSQTNRNRFIKSVLLLVDGLQFLASKNIGPVKPIPFFP